METLTATGQWTEADLVPSPSVPPADDEPPKRTPNGVSRAKRVRREKSGFRKPSKNTAAIDFGTTNCSLGYITENDTLELINGVIKCPFDGGKMRVPTAILLTASGVIDSFGSDARSAYANLEDCDRESYFFLKRSKWIYKETRYIGPRLFINRMRYGPVPGLALSVATFSIAIFWITCRLRKESIRVMATSNNVFFSRRLQMGIDFGEKINF